VVVCLQQVSSWYFILFGLLHGKAVFTLKENMQFRCELLSI